MGDTDQMALEVETLAQRLEFCSGSELLSTLEELESMAASRPDLATVSLPALFKLVNDPSAAGAEATQQAVEVVSRLVSPKVDSSPELAERARLANGEAVVSVPGHVVVLIDLLESDVCETYTVVVVLELLTSLSATRGEELRRAVLAAPAGSARLLETLSDRRDEVRNAGLQLWEHLTRPSAGEFDDLANGLSTGDELRTNFAFNDGFAKVFAAIEEDDGRVAREAARLAANVLAGPPVAATMLQQHNVEPFARLLSRLPRRYADEEEDEETQESEEPDEPRLKSTTVKRHALVADALADAAAGLVALWRLVANDRGGVSSRSQAQATIWKSSSLRSALLSIALESDLDPEKVLFEVADSDNTLVDSPEWWVAFAMNDDRRRGLGASRRAVRAAALEVLRLCLVENEAHALDMCEATFVSRPARVVHALHATLELATFDDSKAGLAACSLAETTWAPEGAAIVVVMHAVAPPPPIDDDSEVLKPALEVVVAAIDADGPIAVRALGLLRRLLARSPSVRELALKIPALKSTSTNDDADEDDAVFLLGAVIRRLFRAETVEKDDSVVTHALAVVCAWLRDNGAAAHALLRDPDHADGVAAIARGSKQNKRAKGLASLALGLCLEHFGDEERAGWTKATVSALVERRVGLGAFA